jgi:aminoglycoside phosphotransferase (APT) family kinase protein
VDPELARIVERAAPGALIIRAKALGTDETSDQQQTTAKAAGYGIPIRIDVEVHGQARSFVLHGSSANQFGHDRRADRAAELLLAADTYGRIPQHVRALEVGAFRPDGSSVSLSHTREFYLLTEYAEGRPYAEDLRRIAETQTVTEQDSSRLVTLVDYLAALHSERLQGQEAYARSLRDLLGSGEGIFGIVDAYPPTTPGAEAHRLQQLERLCLDFRWRLRQRGPRLARSHGDFHPFNVLFDDSSRLCVLDTSRGSLGDPADDVSCLAINFVFFALEAPGSWRAAFAGMWFELWERYLAATGDSELLEVVAPFLCWRSLVLACPVWYPNLRAEARQRLLTFAETALRAERFDPRLAEAVFR